MLEKVFDPKLNAGWVILFFFIIIAVLELGTRSGVITSLTLPRPSDVLATMIELFESGLLFKHLVPSISRLLLELL